MNNDGESINNLHQGDVEITGNLEVEGDMTVAGATVITNPITTDPLWHCGHNNPADLLDLGIVGEYTSSGTKYSGAYREAATGTFKFKAGITTDPDATGVITGGTHSKIGVSAIELNGSTSGTINIDPPAVAGSQSYVLPLALPTSNGQSLIAQTDGTMSWGLSNEVYEEASTGIIYGGVLSIGSPTSTFSISDGAAHIITDDLAGNFTHTNFTWTGKSNISVTNIATNNITFISIQSDGTVVQSTTRPTNIERRDDVFIGAIEHPDRATVTYIDNEQDIAQAPVSQLRDLMGAIGYINVSGNKMSSNSLLTVAKSAGVLFGSGINYAVSLQNPHTETIAAYDTNVSSVFTYINQDGSISAPTLTSIIPGIYDDGSAYNGTTPTVSNNDWTACRWFITPGGTLECQLGQNIYNTLAAAEAAINTETFVVAASVAADAVFIGYMIVKQSATDLTDSSQVKFINAGKFGSLSGNSGVSTLQAVYDASNANPEILTNSTGNAVGIRVGSGADTDEAIQVQQNSGTVNFAVTGEGNLPYTKLGQLKDVNYTGVPSDPILNINSSNNNLTFGDLALVQSTGTDCTIIGAAAGYTGATDLISCTFLGTDAGRGTSSSGDYNTAIGAESMGATVLTSGSQNTCVGFRSGNAITTGSQNVCIGNSSDAIATLDNQIAIGYNTQTTGANQCQIGSSNLIEIVPNASASCALGSTANGFSELVLKGSTSGTLTIQANAAGGTQTYTMPADDGNSNNVLGTNGAGTLNWFAPAFGDLANTSVTGTLSSTLLLLDTSNGAMAFGNNIGVSTGIGNTYFGCNAGYNDNSTGAQNTFMGFNAGASSSSIGGGNVAIGSFSLGNSVATSGDYNTCVGYGSGFASTTGFRNTLIGRDAGLSITTGCCNTFIGSQAGYAIGTTLTKCVVLGDSAYINLAGADNSIAIGYNTIGTTSNETIIGDANMNVIRTTSNNVCDLGSASIAWKDVYGVNGYTTTSDIRKKTNIADCVHGLDFINMLNPITYDIQGHKNVGLSAQHTKECLKDCIEMGIINENNKDNLGIRYSHLIPLLINSIKELNKKIEDLESCLL